MVAAQVRVEIKPGVVRGTRDEDVSTFYAIPYAQAPVGRLRFSPPEPVDRWDGERDCTAPGPIVPQLPSRLESVMGDFAALQNENSLSVTVWAPTGGPERKPVLAWIHGGAFLTGGAGLDIYSGATLAREGDIVVVGINYRLGALGFLHHPKIADGNMGLLDKKLALEWIQQNISAFGGDPLNVTLCGQSAGGLSIAHLLTMKDTASLFRRCIMQSAPLGIEFIGAEEAAAAARLLLTELELDESVRNLRETLAAIPVSRILAAQGAAMKQGIAARSLGPGGQYLPFRPVLDGTVLRNDETAFDRAAGLIDVLIGTTREEYNSFTTYDPAVQQLTVAPVPAADLVRLRARRPGATPADLLSDHLSEKMFIDDSLQWAARAAEAGRRTFVYSFDWQSPCDRLGACHCIELPFVFGTWNAFARAPMLKGANFTQLKKIGAQMRAAWIGFVSQGNPSTQTMPHWPEFSSRSPAIMRIGDIFTAEICAV